MLWFKSYWFHGLFQFEDLCFLFPVFRNFPLEVFSLCVCPFVSVALSAFVAGFFFPQMFSIFDYSVTAPLFGQLVVCNTVG